MLPQKHMEATNAQNRVVDLFAAPIFLMLAVDRINVSDRINDSSGLFKSPLIGLWLLRKKVFFIIVR